MEIESLSPGAVNRFDGKKAHKLCAERIRTRPTRARLSSLEIYDRRTFKLFLRIKGYIDGAWSKSHGQLPFLDWNYPRFSKKTGTNGGKPVPVRTLERQFPRFQRWCEEYEFTEVNVGGRWVIRITRDLRVRAGVPGADVLARLVLAIRKHVAKSGRCRVDLEFCRKFSELTSLPLNEVEHVWRSLKKIEGLKHKWRGEGRGRKYVAEDPARWEQICAEREVRKNQKFVSSDPQTLPPVSISSGNDKIQNSGPADRSRIDRPRAAPARVGDTNAEPGGFEHPGNEPHFGRWFPGCKPVQICGRLVFPRRLLAKANWIAGQRLKFVHEHFPRVEFRFPHARNFALAALRFGYTEAPIVRAWELGVAKSHADAVDAGEYDSQRAPSAAKVYAWNALRGADPRSAEQLWTAFFAAPRVYVKPAGPDGIQPKSPKQRATAKSGSGEISRAKKSLPPLTHGSPRLSPMEAAAELERLRAIVKPATPIAAAPEAAAAPLTLGELAEFLKPRALTIAQFNALPWPRRRWLLDRAAEWRATRQKKPGEKFLDSD